MKTNLKETQKFCASDPKLAEAWRAMSVAALDLRIVKSRNAIAALTGKGRHEDHLPLQEEFIARRAALASMLSECGYAAVDVFNLDDICNLFA